MYTTRSPLLYIFPASASASACRPHSSFEHRRTAARACNANAMETGGLDSDGRQFKSAEEMWREEVGDANRRSQWYKQGVGYWQGVEASVDGVLGGYGHVSEADIKASEAFLNTLFADYIPDAATNRHLVALVEEVVLRECGNLCSSSKSDCGSGIGRVTKNLLIRYFNEVDLLEPVSHFLEASRESLAPENLVVTEMHKPANFFCLPLQEFSPDAERYDIIWVQWCIGHLADDDFVSFFKRAKAGLKPGGLFVVKENVARTEKFKIRKRTCVAHYETNPHPASFKLNAVCGEGSGVNAAQSSVKVIKLGEKKYCQHGLRNLKLLDFLLSFKHELNCGFILLFPGFVLDKDDKSITRSDLYFKELFSQCGLHILKSKDQKGFPGELFPVKMYALSTELPKRANGSRPKRQAYKPGLIK
ncbi:hypothetical protein RJ639_001232 [Escallonia herrerae]|uniref:Alpha N-terminal protein methyltransferase 1 n=1 Tax=Escallonia herrerae TaxID=1293975 RepID=A0AA89BFI0_9ASTE|nr:hypothetical protein RJ639_001232 [Escallonia herrerae]